MSPVQSGTTSEEYVYIDLDQPTHWWGTLVGLIAATLIVGVLIAPWVIDLNDGQPDTVANSTLQSTGSICRPNANGLPGVFDPTVASWSRFCEWFIAPEINPQGEQ